MPSGAPFYLVGTAVAGCSVPTVGIPHGHGVERVDGASPTVDWSDVHASEGDPSRLSRQAYLDGALAATADGGAASVLLPPIRPEIVHRFDLLPLSTGQARINEASPQALFARPIRSDRACLTWSDQPSEADFEAYLIYHNGGGLGDPGTLLAEIANLDQLEYRTGPLATGNHKFALSYRDTLGNVQTIGTAITSVVPERPLPVASVSVDYDQDTRRATITWSNPTQPAGVAGIAIFDNWAPGSTRLAPHANTSLILRRAVLAPSATSFETFNLWEGRDEAGAFQPWRFAVVPILCDAAGTDMATFVEQVLPLKLDGSDLEEIQVPPPKPELISVVPIAGAKWRATWLMPSVDDVTSFSLLEDGSSAGTEAVVAGVLAYEFDSPATSDGSTVEVRARAWNGAAAYADSNLISVTVDGSAPTGDRVLEGALCL